MRSAGITLYLGTPQRSSGVRAAARCLITRFIQQPASYFCRKWLTAVTGQAQSRYNIPQVSNIVLSGINFHLRLNRAEEERLHRSFLSVDLPFRGAECFVPKIEVSDETTTRNNPPYKEVSQIQFTETFTKFEFTFRFSLTSRQLSRLT